MGRYKNTNDFIYMRSDAISGWGVNGVSDIAALNVNVIGTTAVISVIQDGLTPAGASMGRKDYEKPRINYHHLNDEYVIMQIPKVVSSHIFNSLEIDKGQKTQRMFNKAINLNKRVIFLTRNPYDRFVSSFLFIHEGLRKYKIIKNEQLKRAKSFRDFIEMLIQIKHEDLDLHLLPIYWFQDFIEAGGNETVWYKIEEKSTLPMIAKIGNFIYRKNVFKNKNKNRKHYSEYYDDVTKKLIYDYYQEDFKRYKYTF